ncbi:unnamed protein product [Echinostoma caproni]|uniref:NUP50 domain-containing protein n=1 Tax=Echinostoma caproni TaxID=27848 RepID=A0A183AM35_9TREM|nr:unnamed protein product [Echinostoma caproni]
MPLLRKPNPTVSLTPSASVPVTLSQPKSSKNDKSITYTFSSPIRRPPSVAAELVKLSSSNTVPKFSFSSPLRSSRSSSALFYAHSDYPVSSHTNPSNPVVSTSSSPIFTLIVKSSADSDSHTTSKVAPKFEFGSPKLISVPSTTGTHPTFTFGSSFSATPGASNISSTNSNLNSVAPATQTAPAFGGIQLGASVSAPFSFGSAQPNCTSSTTAGNIFCFGSNTQATDAPGSKPPLSFGAPTPLPPGQSANSSSNLFSANASEISARKKVHATRRLNR